MRRVRDRRADARTGVTVYGLDGVKRHMRLAAPELKKQMDKEIRRILEPVQRSARDNVDDDAPFSGWDYAPKRPGSRPSYSPYGKRWEYERLAWDPEQMRRKIRIRQGGRRPRGSIERAAWSVRSEDPAAVVWELMGRGKSNTQMVRTARRLTGQTGRILYRAWDNSYAKQTAPKQIEAVVKHYERELNARLMEATD